MRFDENVKQEVKSPTGYSDKSVDKNSAMYILMITAA